MIFLIGDDKAGLLANYVALCYLVCFYEWTPKSAQVSVFLMRSRQFLQQISPHKRSSSTVVTMPMFEIYL